MPGADSGQQMRRLPRLLGQDQHQHQLSRSLRVDMKDILFAIALGIAGALFLFLTL